MRKKILMVLFTLLVCLWAQRGNAVRTMTVKIGSGEAVVALLDGAAQVASEGKDVFRAMKLNDILKKGDEVKTGPKTKMELILPDKSQLRFADNSRFRLVQIDAGQEQGREVTVYVSIGKAWANVSRAVSGKSNFELTCENAVAGVRGTVYRMNVNEDKSALVKVYDGQVTVTGGGKALEAPTVVGPPQNIEGPKPIPGPRKVTMEEWTFIVRSMQQIVIRGDGTPEQPQEFTAQEDLDDWVEWNKAQDLSN